MGLLTKLPGGGYALAGQEQASQSQQQQPKQDDAPKPDAEEVDLTGVEGTSQQTDGFLPSVSKGTSEQYVQNVASTLIARGTLDPSVISEIAVRWQMEPGAVSASIEAARGEYEKAGRTVARNAGVSDEQWDAFVSAQWKDRPQDMQDAIEEAVHHHNLGKFSKLAKAYARSGQQWSEAELAEATLGDGITMRKDGNKTIVELPGHGSMLLSQAIEFGLVRVRRQRPSDFSR